MAARKRACVALVIDGVLDTAVCGCQDCLDQEHDRIEQAVNQGLISEEVALRQHAALDWDLGDPDRPEVPRVVGSDQLHAPDAISVSWCSS